MTDPFDVPLDELRTRRSVKWRRFPDDVLPLWIAEMDTRVAPGIVDAVHEAMLTGDTGYPVGDAYPRALARFAVERWGWDLDVTRTLVVPDVMRGVAELVRLLTAPGGAVVVTPPVYAPLVEVVETTQRRVIDAPLDPAGRLDPTALDHAFASAVAGGGRAAFLLCSPHNPTGTLHDVDELATVADLARHHGVRVIADEIHAPLALRGARFVPYLTVPGSGDAFALTSASKAWNLAGLKAAVAVAGEEAAAELARVPALVGHGVSHLGVTAHVAALDLGRAWLDDVVPTIAARHDELTRLLAEHLPDAVVLPAEATYLAWVDLGAVGLGDDPAHVLRERGRVAVSPGLEFGPGGAGHVRVNVATSSTVLHEAVHRMALVARAASGRRP